MITDHERADLHLDGDIDITWHDGGPAILVRLTNGQLARRRLTAAECAALIRRLSGYLTYWHKTVDQQEPA